MALCKHDSYQGRNGFMFWRWFQDTLVEDTTKATIKIIQVLNKNQVVGRIIQPYCTVT